MKKAAFFPNEAPTVPQYELRWGDFINPDNPSEGKYYPIHKDQKAILNATARFIGAIAGTGGGKTVTGPLWCIKQIQRAVAKYGKCTGMVIAPTYKVLSRATMPTFVDTLVGTVFEGEYKESKSQYVLPHNWGVIWCQGADNPGGLEGGQFDFVWGDEGGQFKKKTFHAIEGRTGAKQAPILITTTPYGLGYLHDVWYTNFKKGDKDYYIRTWASNVNPGYPEEEYQRAKRSLSPEKFKERYDGEFMRMEGRVYPAFDRAKISMKKDELLELLKGPGKFVGGMDFGWNDPFCALGGFLTPEDVLYVWYERYRSETIIEKHADAIPKTQKTYGRSMIWHCDHNPDCQRVMKRGGHTVKNAKKDILTGILAVNSRIYLDKLKVIENRCIALCAEAETYVYPDKDEEILGDKPVDKDNHAMDALRYMVMGVDHRKKA